MIEGMILIDASVDGLQGQFIFDTGSSALFVNVPDRNKKHIELSTVEGTISGTLIRVAKLEIEDIVLKDVPAVGIDLTKISNELGRNISGILGWTFFGSNAITIDYKSQKIYVGDAFASQTNQASGQYHILKMKMETASDNLPIVEVNIRDRKMTFAFDTGAPLNIIDINKAVDREQNTAQLNTVFEDVIFLNGRVRIENSLFRVENLSILNEGMSSSSLDGILSVHSLNAEKVIIDQSNSRIFIFWEKNSSSGKLASL